MPAGQHAWLILWNQNALLSLSSKCRLGRRLYCLEDQREAAANKSWHPPNLKMKETPTNHKSGFPLHLSIIIITRSTQNILCTKPSTLLFTLLNVDKHIHIYQTLSNQVVLISYSNFMWLTNGTDNRNVYFLILDVDTKRWTIK